MPANGRWDLIRRLKVNSEGEFPCCSSGDKILLARSENAVLCGAALVSPAVSGYTRPNLGYLPY